MVDRSSNETNNILVRVDACEKMGIGHFMRCFAFAQWCERYHLTVAFICKELLPLAEKCLKQINVKYIKLDAITTIYEDAKITTYYIDLYQPRFLLIDGYHFNNEYMSALNSEGCHIIKIDDFGQEIDAAHIILNQNPWATQIEYPKNLKTFLGLEYLLLKKDYWQYLNSRHLLEEKERLDLIVTLGGSDIHGVLLKLLYAISRAACSICLNIHVVLPAQYATMPDGANKLKKANHMYYWHKDVIEMSELLKISDIAVCAAGSICWELAFMNIPMIAISQAENQQTVANSIELLGMGINMGNCNQGFDDKKFQVAFLKLLNLRKSFVSKQKIAEKTEDFFKHIALQY